MKPPRGAFAFLFPFALAQALVAEEAVFDPSTQNQLGLFDWSENDNWSSSEYPNNAGGKKFDVRILSGTAQLSEDVTVQSLVLAGAVEGGNQLTVENDVTITGNLGGRLSGGGSLNIGATLHAQSVLNLRGGWTVSADAVDVSRGLRFRDRSRLFVFDTLTIRDNSDLTGANDDLVTTQGLSATGKGSTTLGVPVLVDGSFAISPEGGVRQIVSDGNLTAKNTIFTVPLDAELQVRRASSFIGSTTFSVARDEDPEASENDRIEFQSGNHVFAGPVNLHGGGNVIFDHNAQVDGGEFNATEGFFVLITGSAGVGNQSSNKGSFRWRGGSIRDKGFTNLSDGVMMVEGVTRVAPNIDRATLSNQGVLILTKTLNVKNEQGLLLNEETVSLSGSIVAFDGGAIRNAQTGVVRLSEGNGGITIRPPTEAAEDEFFFHNQGQIVADTGTLSINGDRKRFQGGTLRADHGGRIFIQGDSQFDSPTFSLGEDSSVFLNSGTMTFSGETAIEGTPNRQVIHRLGTVHVAPGTQAIIRNSASWVSEVHNSAKPQFDLEGPLNLHGAFQLTAALSGPLLFQSGTSVLQDFLLAADAKITNKSASTLQVVNDLLFEGHFANGLLVNEGQLVVPFRSDVRFLNPNNGGVLRNAPNATMFLHGDVHGKGTIGNQGTLQVAGATIEAELQDLNGRLRLANEWHVKGVSDLRGTAGEILGGTTGAFSGPARLQDVRWSGNGNARFTGPVRLAGLLSSSSGGGSLVFADSRDLQSSIDDGPSVLSPTTLQFTSSFPLVLESGALGGGELTNRGNVILKGGQLGIESSRFTNEGNLQVGNHFDDRAFIDAEFGNAEGGVLSVSHGARSFFSESSNLQNRGQIIVGPGALLHLVDSSFGPDRSKREIATGKWTIRGILELPVEFRRIGPQAIMEFEGSSIAVEEVAGRLHVARATMATPKLTIEPTGVVKLTECRLSVAEALVLQGRLELTSNEILAPPVIAKSVRIEGAHLDVQNIAIGPGLARNVISSQSPIEGEFASVTLPPNSEIRYLDDGVWLVPIRTNRYSDWKKRHFTEEEQNDSSVSGQLRDPDKDGIPNLREFLHGTDPRKRDHGAAAPSVKMQKPQFPQTEWGISLEVPVNPASLPFVEITVAEFADGAWVAVPASRITFRNATRSNGQPTIKASIDVPNPAETGLFQLEFSLRGN